MNRRKFFTALSATSILGATGFLYYETNSVDFSYHKINERTDAKVKFAQLSDLHLQRISTLHEEIGTVLEKENLDFIIITGDSIDSNKKLEVLGDFLNLLPAHVRKFAILGNWEHWGGVDLSVLRWVYENKNCQLLINESAYFPVETRKLLITGFDDLIGSVPNPRSALKNIEPQKDHLLLLHCPQFIDVLLFLQSNNPVTHELHYDDELKDYTFSHTFSGHTHGGQINIFGHCPFIPDGSGNYIKGWYKINTHHLYVSRGIGTSILPIRIGARPEVAIFDYYFSKTA